MGPPPDPIRPHTPQEVRRWAHERQPHEREAVPDIGERVLLREADFADPVPAIVAAVQDLTTPGDHWRQHGQQVDQLGPGVPDPSVWAHDDASGWRLAADPWPYVQVQVITHEGGGPPDLAPPRWCKEARVRGSAGWMRPGSRAATGNYEE
jgi:hypothetical protein